MNSQEVYLSPWKHHDKRRLRVDHMSAAARRSAAATLLLVPLNTTELAGPPRGQHVKMDALDALCLQSFIDVIGEVLAGLTEYPMTTEVLPQIAVECTCIMHAVVAIGSIVLAKRGTITEEQALRLHGRATMSLLQALTAVPKDDEACLCASVLLNIYDLSSDGAQDTYIHLTGSRALMADLDYTHDANGMPIKLTPLARMCVWANIFNDTLVAIRHSLPVFWDPDEWFDLLGLSYSSPETASPTWWFRRIHYLLAKLHTFSCVPRVLTEQETRDNELEKSFKALCDDANLWYTTVPEPMQPTTVMETESQLFPCIYIVERKGITAMCMYHAFMIIANKCDPSLPRSQIYARHPTTVHHASRIFGIVKTNICEWLASGAMFALRIALEALVEPTHRNEAIEFVKEISDTYHLNINSHLEAVRQYWRDWDSAAANGYHQ
ncbi:hypothetical protein CJU90_5393 [Yarrowia sp. C11]|nr:hypothetical protein CJU90_5393 [Yarrowia sp. C11]KAG5363990.1 hypothetical protein CKK34_2772 [Yarrowia sp. E02]